MDESRPWRQLGGGGGLWWCAAVFPPEKMQVTFLTKGQLRVANQWLERSEERRVGKECPV